MSCSLPDIFYRPSVPLLDLVSSPQNRGENAKCGVRKDSVRIAVVSIPLGSGNESPGGQKSTRVKNVR